MSIIIIAAIIGLLTISIVVIALTISKIRLNQKQAEHELENERRKEKRVDKMLNEDDIEKELDNN